MYNSLSKCNRLHRTSFSHISNLIDHCLSSKSLTFGKNIHAHLIKLGLNKHTFLGNRSIDIYARLGCVKDALQVFDDIDSKNVFSWNICLKVLAKSCDLRSARKVFDEMPDRDVVSWNTMILCYASNGFSDSGLELFAKMQKDGVRPSGFTLSIVVSCVTCSGWGKQIHGKMMRNGVDLCNVVVGNSLIDMYGKFGVMDYAFGVFFMMEEVDVISWNSLLSGCCKSGYDELALNQFRVMVERFSPDEFTISTIITACSNLQDLAKGKQILTLCFKLGFLSNTIVSSAMIDLFAKCNRVEDSVRIFEGIDVWDSVVCNSMISSYGKNGFEDNALQLFILSLRKNIKPTDFTLSCVVSCCASVLVPTEQGCQIHCLVVKLGYESDFVIASSLVEMYNVYGSIDSGIMIFSDMSVIDLVSWNTMILGLANNGKEVGSLNLFEELLERGPLPDHVTLAGVLLACKNGRFVDEGIELFELMEKVYGIKPVYEHYACVVEMMSQAGKLKEALNILETMPFEPKALLWESLLHASELYGDLRLIECVSERIIDLQPQSSLPYLVLAKAYERTGRWESLVRVRKKMGEESAKETVGCSWIGIRNRVYLFEENQLLHHFGKAIYSILKLLIKDTVDTKIIDIDYQE